MKGFYNADIFSAIIIIMISALFIFFYPLGESLLILIPYFLILFILPGFFIAIALYPLKGKRWLIKYILIGILLSSASSLLFTILILSFKAPLSYIFTFLVFFSIIMAFASLIRRRKLRFYVKCKECSGYYELKKGEFLDDFSKCTCGGELEYWKPDFPKVKSKLPEYFDALIVIILTLITVAVLGVPQLNNSAIRTISVPILLFFLSGYALTASIYPYRNSISRLKRLLLSILSSAVILFISMLILSYSFQTVPSNIFILSLSILTITLVLITCLRRIIAHRRAKIKSDVKAVKPEKSKVKAHDTKNITTKINEPMVSKKKEIKSGTGSNYHDLILVLMVTIFAIISVVVPVLNDSFIRTIFGLLFILFLPGYSLIAALFPKIRDLDGIERVALSFGLSIAVAPLIGLGLNYTPFGIRLTPILVSLSIFTISMLFIAFIRRRRIPEDDRFSVDFGGFFKSIRSSFSHENRTDKILSLVLVASIILAISMTTYVIVSPKEGEKFTEFYILGPNGKASDYPTNLTAGGRGNLTIGIVNHEYANITYKLAVKLDNRTLKEQNITLANNQKYEGNFNFTAGTGEKQKLEFLLYKLPDSSNVYRSLHLWINVR